MQRASGLENESYMGVKCGLCTFVVCFGLSGGQALQL